MNQINPNDLIIVKGLPPVAKSGDKVSIDSEFFGQEKNRLHRPHGTCAYLGCSFDGKTVYYITDESQIQEFYTRLDAAVQIYVHAKYDITQLRRFAHLPQRKKLWDCMLIEQIMFSGYYTDFGLADLARRYLHVYMSKDVRETFSDGDTISQEQIEYACVDVAATWRVYKEQRAIIDENDLNIWKNIELPFLWVIMGMGGVKLDSEKWQALAEKNKETADTIQKKYDSINLNSPKQVKEHLKSLGYKLDSTDVEALESISEDCEFARDMLVYRTYAKRSSTYGTKFIEDYVEEDGRIYSDLYQMGAETGRSSCRAPNLQNQPHEFEYRDCFVASPKHCMIVADWGSQEPRIAAYLSGDERLMEALNSPEKLYIAIARDVLEKTIKKESDEYKQIKSTVLGIFYGMSAKGLSKRIGRSVEDAQEMIDAFLETYPQVRDYMDKQSRSGDYVETIYGRKIWLNKYSYQWERNALNAPIQGSAADAMKLASRRFLDEWCGADFYDETPLRLLVHDEVVLESPKKDCEKMSKVLESSMVSVAEEMHEGIKGVIEIYSGESWACKS